MSSIVLIGGGIVFGCAMLTDAKQAVALTATAITIKGVAFLSEKIAENSNKNASQIISTTGWCLFGIPAIGILKLSLNPLYTIKDSFDKFQGSMAQLAEWADKLTFWN